MYLPENAKAMFRKLIEFVRRLGRDPTFNEVRDNPDLPNPNDFAFYFGSFTDALKEAHRIVFVYKKEPEWMQSHKTFKVKEDESMPRWSNQQLTDSLQKLWDELGHFPTPTEVSQCNYCAAVLTYEKRFGTTWNGVRSAMEHTKRINEASEAIKTRNTQTEGDEPEMGLSKEEFTDKMLAAKSDRTPKVGPDGPGDASEPVAEAILGPVEEPSEILPPAEINEVDVRFICLLPRAIIAGIAIADYASVLRMHDSMPLLHTIGGIPICKDYENLQILKNGKISPFPEPQDGTFYIVERPIALSARLSGRTTDDLLIPKKYTKDGATILITEFTTL